MGRKPKMETKTKLTISVDEKLLVELEKDGVNKSRLFSLAARKYLKKKNKL